MSKTLILFDVDGTLTAPRNEVKPDMLEALSKLSQNGFLVGIVGGSDISKIAEQLCKTELELKRSFEFVFSENGLVSFQKSGRGFVELSKDSMVQHLGEELMQKLINFCLHYMSQITLPCKRGTFIEYRRGMLNVSPVGRACSQEERDQFFQYDKEHNIRKDMVAALQKEFGSSNIKFSIGGQISIDVFPVGWDKTYCLQFVEARFECIHFVGDKTSPGGNDFEIFSDPRTIGHSVSSPDDTIELIGELIRSVASDQ